MVNSHSSINLVNWCDLINNLNRKIIRRIWGHWRIIQHYVILVKKIIVKFGASSIRTVRIHWNIYNVLLIC